MNIGTEQVFIVNASELEQQNQHTAPLQRAFAMPVAVAVTQPDEAQTSMCLPQSMGAPSRTQMCRLCATVTEMVVPIFDGEGLQNNLADKIHQHLPIQVSENDLLPVVMCFQCTSTLLAWHELVVCSVQADSVMRERFNLNYTQQQQQQQCNAQSNQNPIKHEKCQARWFPPRAHASLLLVCGAADAQRDAHPRGGRTRAGKIPEKCPVTDRPTKRSAVKTIIPVRIRRSTEPPPLVEISTVTSSVGSIRVENDHPNSPSIGASRAGTVEPPPLQKIGSKTSYGNVPDGRSPEPSENRNENIEPNEGPRKRGATDREPNDRPADSPERTARPERTSDFSDHSDTENEFGRLPESVFDAIEDSQDAPSSDDGRGISRTDRTGETKAPNPPRPCPVCDKRCNSLSGWYYHSKHAHGARKNLACDECGGAFATKGELATHARTHSEEKPFACRTCSSAFSSRAGRYIHEQTHGGPRAHACPRCPRAFRWRAQLARHAARHEAARRHACARCPRAFSVRADLRRHERAHSPGCHRCHVCDATFKQKRYLKVHLENIHAARPAAGERTCKTKKPVPASLAPAGDVPSSNLFNASDDR